MKKQLQLLIIATLGCLGVRAWGAEPTVLTFSNRNTSTPAEITITATPKLTETSPDTTSFTLTSLQKTQYSDSATSDLGFKGAGSATFFTPDVNVHNTGSWSATFTYSGTEVLDLAKVKLAVVTYNSGGSEQGKDRNATFKVTIGSETKKVTDYTFSANTFTTESPTNVISFEFSKGTSLSANGTITIVATKDDTTANKDDCYFGLRSITLVPPTVAYERAVSGSDNVWNDTTSTGWNGGLPGEDAAVTLTASGADAQLTMDAIVNIASLTVNGSSSSDKLIFLEGTIPATETEEATVGSLTVGETIINADTDLSGISANLGAVTLAGGKQLTVQSSSQYTSISRANASILHVKGDVADTTYLQNNTILKTSGTTTINGDLTFTGAGRTWVFNKESDTTGAATVSGRLVLANASGASSYLTIQNGATLTIESANTTMGVSGSDGAAFLGNYSATTQVLVTGEGSHFNVPNGAVNLARDASPTIKVEKGALFSAYCLNGDTNGGVPTMTVENAELRLGKADGTGRLKMVETKLNLKDAVLSANGDWGITSDSTQGQIVLSGTIVVKPMNHVVTIRKISGEGGVSVEGGGRVVFADDILIDGGLGLGDGTTVDIGAWHPTLTALGVNTSLTLSAGENVISVRLPVADSITKVPEGLSVSVTEWTDVEPTLEIEEGALVISRPIPTRTWAPTTVDNEGFVDWSSDWSGSDTATVAVLDFRHLSGDAKVTIPAETEFEMTEFLGGNQTLTVTLEEGASLGSLTVIGHVVFKSVGFGAMTIADGYVVSFDTKSEITINNQIVGDGVVKIASGNVSFTGTNTYTGGTVIEKDATLTITHWQALGTSGSITGHGVLEIATDYTSISGTGTEPLANKTGLTNDAWCGTVRFKTKGDKPKLVVDEYGHLKSFIEFDGAEGWMPEGNTIDVLAPIKLINEGLSLQNGTSDSSNTHIKFTSLTGDGMLWGAKSGFDYGLFIADAATFTGSIDLTKYGKDSDATSSGDTLVVIGSKEKPEGYAFNDYRGTITVLSGATVKIAADQTWKPYSDKAVKVNGTLGGVGSVDGKLVFANGATLDAREGAVTVSGDVTFPTGENEVLKVIVAEEPTVGTVLLKGAGLTAETLLPQVDFVNAAGESLDASSVAVKVTDEGLVIAKKAVASWNNQSFETLQAAIEAAAQAGDEQTITLLVSPNAEDLTIPAGATINLTGEGVLNGLVVVEGSLKVDENITVTQGILTYKTLEETTCFASDLNAHMANDESIGGFKVRESLTITLDVPLTKSVRFKPTGTAATVALQSNLRPTQANLDLYVFEDGVKRTESWSNKSPIALWEGDFADGDAKVGALTFNLNNESGSATGNRLEGGSLVIGDTQGAVFAGAENLLNEGTYFIQGADLMSNGIQYTHLMAVMANDESTGQVGLSMMSNGNPGWISANAGNSFDLGTPQREIILTGDSLLIVTASQSNGLSLYRILPGARTTVEKVFEKSNLTFNAAKGFVLGGGKTAIEGNLASAEGWTIQKLAVFDYVMTEAEMQSYMFPSERETITAETFSASELNALITTKPDLAEVVFHQDVTLTLDDALNAETIKFMSNYAVGLTVSADAELPSDLTAYDFTLVQGDVTLAGGLKPEQFLTAAEVQTVVGVNFYASAGGDTSSALEAGTWFAAEDNKGRAKLFEGLSTLSWSAAAVATANANDTTFLNGSLNENVTVTLTNVPYETFDLIVYCSDTENCTVSDAGAVSTQSAPNAKRYNGITRAENYMLTISASCLAGFQILPAGTYTGLVLTVPADGTTWNTAANWTYNQVGGNSDPATVVVSGNSTVTVSENVTIDTLTVKGAGELTLQLANGVTFAAADLVCEEGASLKVVKAEGATTATLRITEALSDRMVVTIGDGVTLDIAETVNPQMKAVFDFEGTAIVNVYLANEGDYKVVQVPATATKVTENENLTLNIFVAGTPVVSTEDWSIVTVENATVDGLASHYTTIAQYPVWMNYDGKGKLGTASCWSTGAKPTAATSVILDVLDSGYLAGAINVSDTIYFRGIDGVTVSFEYGSFVTTKNIVTLTPGMSLLQYIYIYSEESSYAPIMPSGTFEMKHEDNELVIMTYNANYENEVTITGKGSVRVANSNFDKTGNGAVIMTKANTYTGGTIVESTMSLTSTVAGGYGAAGSTIVVEDGASVDVANTAGYDYNYQIVGKGIYYADYQYYTGALYHIPTAANDETYQIPYAKSIHLTGDAMIRVGVQAEDGAPRTWGVTDTLDLHGHQLQKQAQGTFILKGTTGNFGEFRVMEGGLQVEAEGATLSDVTLSIEDKSTLTLNGTLAGLAKLRFKAGNEGITMTGIDNYEKGTSVVEVDASYVNVGVADFDTLYLKTDANENESAISRGYIELVKGGKDSVGKSEIFSNDFVDTYYVGSSRLANGRLKSDSTAIIADVEELEPFWHYAFNNGTGNTVADGALGADALYKAEMLHGTAPELAYSRHGKAGHVTSSTELYWDRVVSMNSAESAKEGEGAVSYENTPFSAGVITITTLVKPAEVGDRVLWAWGDGDKSTAIALVAQSDKTLSVERVAYHGAAQEIMHVDVPNLTNRYHFVVLEIDPAGGRLGVWDPKARDYIRATSPVGLFSQVPASGRLGHIHGGWLGGLRAIGSQAGCFIDDWQIYDIKLTPEELQAIRLKVAPDRAMIQIR